MGPSQNPNTLYKELIGTLFEADAGEENPEDEAPVIDDNPFHEAWDDDSPRPVATRSDWKAEPMPEQHVEFQMRRHIPPEQMACLRRGNIPKEMEDKWFWYMEENTLYAHRSWTGICVFILRFDPDSDAIQVTVNRDPEQFGSKSVEEDAAQIHRLLDWWTQPEYDYYHEWLSETLMALEKRGVQEKE